MVGLAGEGQNFDGNGMYVRFQPGGGDQTLSTGPVGRHRPTSCSPTRSSSRWARGPPTRASARPTSPTCPATRTRCPNLNGAAPTGGSARRRAGTRAARRRAAEHTPRVGARAMRTAIRKHARDFAFVIGLVLVSRCVGGYILSNQRFYLPNWVPVVGSDFVDYKAQFSTAQSVTPGQGQTVQVAGVDVGDITKVDLVDGRAVVTMKIRRKYTPIYKNATALLRPKTGLNDMVIELDAGHADGGQRAAGLHRPDRPDAAQRQLRRDPLLAGHATRAPTCSCCVGAAGEGLDGQGKALSADAQALRADRPLPGQAQRRAGRARAQHPPLDPQLQPALAGAGRQGRRPGGAGRLLQRVFKAFADQDANLRAALQELPGALQATNTTLAKVDQAGQRARADPRRPAARRPRARAVAGPDAAVPAPRRRRSSRTSCGPSRAPRCRWSRSCGPRRATSRSSRPS